MLTPLQHCLFTHELQWQFRGKWRILQGGVQTGNARARLRTQGVPPTPRFSHGCAAIHNCVVVFGGTGHGVDGEGQSTQETFDDTHVLDMRRPVPLWSQVQPGPWLGQLFS
jgi:hypothetical protein